MTTKGYDEVKIIPDGHEIKTEDCDTVRIAPEGVYIESEGKEDRLLMARSIIPVLRDGREVRITDAVNAVRAAIDKRS